MQRGKIGRYEVTSVAGERVRAFVPKPLPPKPALNLNGSLQQALESTGLALGRLDSVSTLLPDPSLFIYAFMRKEAVLSSQIEGLQSSLQDLLLFELQEGPGIPLDDVVEVSNYVAALEHGLLRLEEGSSLSNRLIREIHGVLLSSGRGSSKAPGEFRRSQNWIGGSRPGSAVFVPPPHTAVPDCMAALKRFLHTRENSLSVLLRVGLAHLQFETIHPFLDGNGRVGRLLITLLLCHAGMLREPLLYLSLYFKQHRASYYDLLNRVRRSGNWERWLTFFLDGIRLTATDAVSTTQRIARIFQEDHDQIVKARRLAKSVLLVHDALKARPILSLTAVCNHTKLSFPTVTTAMDLLVQLGIAREITGKTRNRLFIYDQYLAILNEGTEMP